MMYCSWAIQALFTNRFNCHLVPNLNWLITSHIHNSRVCLCHFVSQKKQSEVLSLYKMSVSLLRFSELKPFIHAHIIRYRNELKILWLEFVSACSNFIWTQLIFLCRFVQRPINSKLQCQRLEVNISRVMFETVGNQIEKYNRINKVEIFWPFCS